MSRKGGFNLGSVFDLANTIAGQQQAQEQINRMFADIDDIVDVLQCDDPDCTPESHLKDIADILRVRVRLPRRKPDAPPKALPPVIDAVIVEEGPGPTSRRGEPKHRRG